MHNLSAVSLSAMLAEAGKLGAELITAIKHEAVAHHNGDAVLPDSVTLAKQRFLAAQAIIIQHLNTQTSALPAEILPELTGLQALIDQMATAALDGLIEAYPEAIEFQYERAGMLLQMGREVEALSDYQTVLTHAPTHFGALNDLGKFYMESGQHTRARQLIAQAVAAHPQIAVGQLNLADLLLFQSDYALAKQHYQIALELEPGLSAAHQGLALALAALGDEQAAVTHRELGFRGQAVMTWPQRGSDAGIPLLVLSSAYGGNMPIKQALDRRLFQTTVVLSEYFDASTSLPPHQLIINLIGDADLCQEGLAIAESLLSGNRKPVLNHPALVKKTGRLDNAKQLAGLPGVVTPRTELLSRHSLLVQNAEQILADLRLEFPLLLRSPGFHTGQFFQRVEKPADLSAVVASLPGQQILVMQMLDARNRLGDYHKYRVMFVDGELYPLHLAISKDWKIHYFSADMADNPEYRHLEAAFLENMPKNLGEKAMLGLTAIREALQLDYGGIDFALGVEGEVLLFEANATMAVHRPAEQEIWRYRQHATDRVLDAVRQMIIKRARLH